MINESEQGDLKKENEQRHLIFQYQEFSSVRDRERGSDRDTDTTKNVFLKFIKFMYLNRKCQFLHFLELALLKFCIGDACFHNLDILLVLH